MGRKRINSDWDRFWPKVDASGDCWLWTGYLNSQGYGQFNSYVDGAWKRRLAHRWAWETLIGPIPEGMEPHHQCKQTACVYVGGHVVVVTPTENRLQSWGPARLNTLKTHCPQGHQLTGANLQIRVYDGRPTRRCAECHRQQERARHARRQGVLA